MKNKMYRVFSVDDFYSLSYSEYLLEGDVYGYCDSIDNVYTSEYTLELFFKEAVAGDCFTTKTGEIVICIGE